MKIETRIGTRYIKTRIANSHSYPEFIKTKLKFTPELGWVVKRFGGCLSSEELKEIAIELDSLNKKNVNHGNQEQ